MTPADLYRHLGHPTCYHCHGTGQVFAHGSRSARKLCGCVLREVFAMVMEERTEAAAEPGCYLRLEWCIDLDTAARTALSGTQLYLWERRIKAGEPCQRIAAALGVPQHRVFAWTWTTEARLAEEWLRRELWPREAYYPHRPPLTRQARPTVAAPRCA